MLHLCSRLRRLAPYAFGSNLALTALSSGFIESGVFEGREFCPMRQSYAKKEGLSSLENFLTLRVEAHLLVKARHSEV